MTGSVGGLIVVGVVSQEQSPLILHSLLDFRWRLCPGLTKSEDAEEVEKEEEKNEGWKEEEKKKKMKTAKDKEKNKKKTRVCTNILGEPCHISPDYTVIFSPLK